MNDDGGPAAKRPCHHSSGAVYSKIVDRVSREIPRPDCVKDPDQMRPTGKPREGRQSVSPRREPGVPGFPPDVKAPGGGDRFICAPRLSMTTQVSPLFRGFGIVRGCRVTPGSRRGLEDCRPCRGSSVARSCRAALQVHGELPPVSLSEPWGSHLIYFFGVDKPLRLIPPLQASGLPSRTLFSPGISNGRRRA